MRVIIIDDEERARKSVKDLLKLSGFDAQLVGEADSVHSGLKAIHAHVPDLLLLDINLPDGTGFDLLKKLDKIPFKIIFITAYEEFAIKAFEFSAIDYLLKPLDPLKFVDSLEKAKQAVEQENLGMKLNALFSNLEDNKTQNKKLVLKTAENIYLVNTREIIRCESDGGYTQFFMDDGRHILVSRNLKDFEELLEGFGFFRIHQSHLINLRFIDHYNKLDGGTLVMKDTSTLPVARRKKEDFLKILEMM
ncbi:MAG: response regulator transcription factor [Bacteroidales bacterium]|nr:response regulator transcription factor [Bacteroidales bacterium]